MTTHASKFGCPYGKCYKDRNTGKWKKGTLRNLSNLTLDQLDWAVNGKADRSKLKDFYNVEFKPLLTEENKGIAIVALAPPPALHTFLLGPVNDLMELLEKKRPVEFLEFTGSLHIVKEKYHSGKYEGNECRKILANVGCLKFLLPSEYQIFAKCLEALGKSYAAVGGMKLRGNYAEAIAEFSALWDALHEQYGISITNKVYICLLPNSSTVGTTVGQTHNKSIHPYKKILKCHMIQPWLNNF